MSSNESSQPDWEKAFVTMANTYGGLILIGVEETIPGTGVAPVKGLPLVPGLRERVIQIGINAIYPPVIPDVRVVEFKSSDTAPNPDRAVVVIRVDERRGRRPCGRGTDYCLHQS